jgi:glycosyltransferase involved in cell wall biosynthesis
VSRPIELRTRYRLHAPFSHGTRRRFALDAGAARETLREVYHLLRHGPVQHPAAAEYGADVVADRTEMLRRRLQTAAEALVPGRSNSEGESLSRLMAALVNAARQRGDLSGYWLILATATAGMPTAAEVIDLRRDIELAGARDYVDVLLGHILGKLHGHHAHYRLVRLIGGVVADVDGCATNNMHSGIQRVTRALLAAWRDKPTVTPVAWMQNGQAYRALTRSERRRVFEWSDQFGRHDAVPSVPDPLLSLVPWDATVFYPEVPKPTVVEKIGAIARCSVNDVHVVGYDMIPSLSGSFVAGWVSTLFANYLAMLKYASQIIVISKAVGEEFGGFSDALAAQGLAGPRVTPIVLPDEGVGETARQIQKLAEEGVAAPEPLYDRPVVLSVGSFEPRKNQIALLNAAELLWQKGRDFSVILIGHGGDDGYRIVQDRYAELVVSGRPVSMVRGATDAHLALAYERATVTTFLSLQEGFGLPLVESFAAHVPVVHTDYGSVAEVGAPGGGIAVDPLDIGAVADALESALFDPAVRARLREEIAARTERKWSHYSSDVWDALHDATETGVDR